MNHIKILTPSGWSKFQGVRRIIADATITLYVSDTKIQCTYDHKMKMNTGQFKKANQISMGDILFDNNVVLDIEYKYDRKFVYDAINVELNHQFYANNLVVSNCIILSTPRGVGGKFHKLWIQAQQGSSKFNPISLPWQVHPERDQAFRDQQTIEMGDKKARQQFDCDFASSGDTVIIKQVLQKISNTTIIQPIQKLYNNEVWIWAMPQFEKTYMISADVARGDGADFSGFEIICVQDNEQVGQYKGKIATDEYGRLLIRFAKMYNNAFLIVENANIGWAVLQQIFKQGYANVYYHKKDYKYVDLELESKMQSAYKPSSKQRDIPGFVTSSRTRPLIIQKMVTLLQNGQFVIHSKRLMNQLWTFVWTHGKPEAMRGYNDDLVMAFAIGLWVRMTSYIIRMEAKKFTHQRLSMIDSGVNRHIQSGEKMPASGFYNSRHINQESAHLYKVGNETINILDFYFGHLKNNKDNT